MGVSGVYKKGSMGVGIVFSGIIPSGVIFLLRHKAKFMFPICAAFHVSAFYQTK